MLSLVQLPCTDLFFKYLFHYFIKDRKWASGVVVDRIILLGFVKTSDKLPCFFAYHMPPNKTHILF